MQKIRHPLFTLELPPGWRWIAEQRGGSAVASDPPGVLHLSAEPVEKAEELPNLSRMLAGFVTRHVAPVTTQELIPVDFPRATGFAWQFVEETADRPPHLWRVWIAGNEEAWCFLSFNCSYEDREAHRVTVDEVVASLSLSAPDGGEPPTGPAG